MDITCSVIKDLLPLYIDKLTSDDSNALIETHLAICTQCAEFYCQMTSSIAEPKSDTIEPAEEEHKVLTRIKNHVLLTRLAFLAMGALFGIYATAKNQLQGPFLIYPLIGIVGEVLVGGIWMTPAVVFAVNSIATLLYWEFHFGSVMISGILATLTLLGSLLAYCVKRVIE